MIYNYMKTNTHPVYIIVKLQQYNLQDMLTTSKVCIFIKAYMNFILHEIIGWGEEVSFSEYFIISKFNKNYKWPNNVWTTIFIGKMFIYKQKLMKRIKQLKSDQWSSKPIIHSNFYLFPNRMKRMRAV